MRYSFDPSKRANNRKKHGFDLADARQVIESGQTVTFEDRRFAYDEERFVTLGPLGDTLVVFRLSRPSLNWKAIKAHSSQFVWYRRLFVVLSWYTYVNRRRRTPLQQQDESRRRDQ